MSIIKFNLKFKQYSTQVSLFSYIDIQIFFRQSDLTTALCLGTKEILHFISSSGIGKKRQPLASYQLFHSYSWHQLWMAATWKCMLVIWIV